MAMQGLQASLRAANPCQPCILQAVREQSDRHADGQRRSTLAALNFHDPKRSCLKSAGADLEML
jgi:hypothetical protein